MWLYNTYVNLYAKDPGTINFWIQGTTVTGKHINQPAQLINNCGPNSQDIWLATPGSAERSKDKNLSPSIVELYSATEVFSMFTQIDPTRCEIEKFEVFDEVSGSLLVSGNLLYSVLALSSRTSSMDGLDIDTTVAMTDGTVVDITHSFAIKATAKGGFVQWKPVRAKIIVCGSEAIWKMAEGAHVVTRDIGPSA